MGLEKNEERRVARSGPVLVLALPLNAPPPAKPSSCGRAGSPLAALRQVPSLAPDGMDPFHPHR